MAKEKRYKIYSRQELEKNIAMPSEDKKIFINNILVLQDICNHQHQTILLMKQRWNKTGKMIQGLFQRPKDMQISNGDNTNE